MTKNKRVLWHFPWRYRESALFIGGMICVGFLLQILTGHFDFYLLHKPVNYILAWAIAASIFLAVFLRDHPLIQWLSSIPFTVSLLGFFLFLTMFMGLIPQVKIPPLSHSIFDRLGFSRIISSWPFVILYILVLFSLGLTTVRRFFPFHKNDIPFVLNHSGLWFVLLAAGLGAADIQRHIMHVTEKEIEWRVYDDQQNVLELPLAIKLNDFDMEEYPPGLMIVNGLSGTPQPQGKPQRYQVNIKQPRTVLGKWDITVKEYIPHAVWEGKGSYRSMNIPGSAPAVNVTARHMATGEEKEGWIWGDPSQEFMKALPLDGPFSLIITRGEPKRFLSDIAVQVKDGGKKETLLEVNKPLRIGSWMVYQYGYDQRAGKYSRYSSFIVSIKQLFLIGRGRPDEKLYPFIDNVVYAGTGFLLLGLLTGAFWAKEAWGDYWSWDPKETWALITAVGYLFYIHIRRDKSLSVYAMAILPLAFVFLMMAWCGVSYLPAAKYSIHLYS